MGDENPIRTLRDYSKPSHEGYKNTIELPVRNNVDLALYDNKSWYDPRDFAKPVKVIVLPQDVPSTSDRLIKLETQVQRLMEAHLTLIQPTQVNKITTSCEICNGLMTLCIAWKTPEQAFVDYASSCTDEARGKCKMTNKIKTVLKAITDRIAGTLPSDTVKNLKLGATLVLSARSYPTEDSQCSNHIHSSINAITIHPKQPKESQVNKPGVRQEEKEKDGEVMFIKIIRDDDEPQNRSLNEGEGATTEGPMVEYLDTFPTRYGLTYHKCLMCGPIPLIFLRNPIIMEGCPSNLKIPCNIGHFHVEKTYIDLDSPLNIMTRMMYNWIMRRKLNSRENANREISNFIGRVKGMHVFVGNFTYVLYFMIIEDISDPRLSQVVLGRPFIEVSNMTHDLPEGVVRFTNENNEVTYKMPHKIEQYNSLSNLEKEHTQSVYLRNEEDKKRGVDYVMSKILGFYKECLELGPEYVSENQLLSVSLLICLGKHDCVEKIPS
nr:MAK10-like protein [Tanacetum cinerariifolium]